MDDSRKRVSRERLEPYFRLHREAHLNIIRNWQGQNTEETFYQLADEYGMMVWNDFWASTQDSNARAGRSGAVPRECTGCGAAISQSSVDCDVVRAEWRGPPPI